MPYYTPGGTSTGEGGPETDPNSLHLDQTTPQDVTGGAPNLSEGAIIKVDSWAAGALRGLTAKNVAGETIWNISGVQFTPDDNYGGHIEFLASPNDGTSTNALTRMRLDADGKLTMVDAAGSPTFSMPNAAGNLGDKLEMGADGVVVWTPSATVGSNVREQLTADITRYVRTDGADTNDGTADTAEGAWLTIQKAVDVCSRYDLGGFNITIQVGDGTYAESVALKTFAGAGVITITGNSSDIDAVVVDAPSGTLPAFWADSIRGQYDLTWMKITGSGIRADGAGTLLSFGNIEFGDCTGKSHIMTSVMAVMRNFVVSGSPRNYLVSGPANYHFNVSKHAQIFCSSSSVTITNTPDFGIAYTYIVQAGVWQGFSYTTTGSCTGKRFDVDSGGQTVGTTGSATYFPGDVAGTVDAAEFALYN